MFKEELESPSSDHYNELIFSQSVDEPYIKKEPNSAQFSKRDIFSTTTTTTATAANVKSVFLNTFRDISDIESDSSNKEDGLNSGSYLHQHPTIGHFHCSLIVMVNQYWAKPHH